MRTTSTHQKPARSVQPGTKAKAAPRPKLPAPFSRPPLFAAAPLVLGIGAVLAVHTWLKPAAVPLAISASDDATVPDGDEPELVLDAPAAANPGAVRLPLVPVAAPAALDNAVAPAGAVTAASVATDVVDAPLGRTALGAVRKDKDGRLVVPFQHSQAVLTRDAALEDKLEKTLSDGHTPWAATVLLEVGTGRVLAMASHSDREPNAHDLALRPMAPAASVFKIVTTSALLREGVSPEERVCFHGGHHRMAKENLTDSRRDGTCVTLEEAVAKSANVAIAKLAQKHLTPAKLKAEAARFGFDSKLPFLVDAPASTTNIPEDPFGFANTAAGFGDVKLSALGGAVLASVVANDGMLIPPQLVDGVEGPDDAPASEHPARKISLAQAKSLRAMMTDTVTQGTARKAFNDRKTPRLTTTAAGKTGSLTDYANGHDTTWFVGFAPADHPEVVVASVVVNEGGIWHIKAPYAAKEALRMYFQQHPPTATSTTRQARR